MFEHFEAPHLLSGCPPQTPILVAFSGGSDSVALLAALRDYAAQHGTPLRAAHINHGIRGAEAVRDRDFCVALCAQWNIPISVLDADVPARRRECGGSMEEVARQVRYEYFSRVMKEYDIPLLATAHHAGDQLETILLHLTRGTGADGLCGIPPVRAMDGGRLVIRPLLRCTKPALEAFCRENGLDFVVDSTNTDISYARNRIRQCVIPQLQQINPAVYEAATRLSETMRADVSFLTEQTDTYVRELVSLRPQSDGAVLVTAPHERLAQLPTACLRRVLVRMMKYAGCPQAEERFVSALSEMLFVGQGRLSLSGGVEALCTDGQLSLTRAQACQTSCEEIPAELPLSLSLSSLPMTVQFGEFRLNFSDTPTGEMKNSAELQNVYNLCMNPPVDFDTIKGTAVLRVRRAGDAFWWHGHHRKLKKLLCDCRVPQSLRDRLPLLCDEDGILLVPGIGVRDGASCKEDTEHPFYVSISYATPDHTLRDGGVKIRNQQKEETDEE